jgi:uncharacterized coiled-coil protein SlyX
MQELKQTLITQLNTIQNLSVAIKASTEKVTQGETNVNLLTRQIGKMSGAIIAIIKEKLSLYIFCEKRRKDINDKNINTDKNLILTVVN